MGKIDDAIHDLKNDLARASRKGYDHVTCGAEELEALLDWAARVREKNPFVVGDRVNLAVSSNPEDGEQPTSGTVISVRQKGVLIRPDAGQPYDDTLGGLWYDYNEVERIED